MECQINYFKSLILDRQFFSKILQLRSKLIPETAGTRNCHNCGKFKTFHMTKRANFWHFAQISAQMAYKCRSLYKANVIVELTSLFATQIVNVWKKRVYWKNALVSVVFCTPCVQRTKKLCKKKPPAVR